MSLSSNHLIVKIFNFFFQHLVFNKKQLLYSLGPLTLVCKRWREILKSSVRYNQIEFYSNENEDKYLRKYLDRGFKFKLNISTNFYNLQPKYNDFIQDLQVVGDEYASKLAESMTNIEGLSLFDISKTDSFKMLMHGSWPSLKRFKVALGVLPLSGEGDGMNTFKYLYSNRSVKELESITCNCQLVDSEKLYNDICQFNTLTELNLAHMSTLKYSPVILNSLVHLKKIIFATKAIQSSSIEELETTLVLLSKNQTIESAQILNPGVPINIAVLIDLLNSNSTMKSLRLEFNTRSTEIPLGQPITNSTLEYLDLIPPFYSEKNQTLSIFSLWSVESALKSLNLKVKGMSVDIIGLLKHYHRSVESIEFETDKKLLKKIILLNLPNLKHIDFSSSEELSYLKCISDPLKSNQYLTSLSSNATPSDPKDFSSLFTTKLLEIHVILANGFDLSSIVKSLSKNSTLRVLSLASYSHTPRENIHQYACLMAELIEKNRSLLSLKISEPPAVVIPNESFPPSPSPQEINRIRTAVQSNPILLELTSHWTCTSILNKALIKPY